MLKSWTISLCTPVFLGCFKFCPGETRHQPGWDSGAGEPTSSFRRVREITQLLCLWFYTQIVNIHTKTWQIYNKLTKSRFLQVTKSVNSSIDYRDSICYIMNTSCRDYLIKYHFAQSQIFVTERVLSGLPSWIYGISWTIEQWRYKNWVFHMKA